MITKFNIFLNEHITSTGRWGNVAAGILPYSKSTNKFLLALRSNDVLEPNTWGIWGGKIEEEDMDNIEQTAFREFEEETEYNGDMEILPSYIYKEEGFTFYNFIGLLDNEFIPELNWEQDGYKWVTIEELMTIEPKHFGLKLLIENNKHQLETL